MEASRPATEEDHDPWARFEVRVQALVPAVVGLATMFTARHLPCPLRALSGSLGQMAVGGFDVVTLRVLHAIAPRRLSVAFDLRDPGASNLTLVLHDEEEDKREEATAAAAEGKGKKRKKPAPPPKKKQARGGSFRAQPPIENLEGKVAALKEAFLQDLARFCQTGRRTGQPPPPLNKAEEAAAATAQAAVSSSSSSSIKEGTWAAAEGPITPANFLRYVQTLPFYRGQLRHTETLPGRAARTVPLAALPQVHAGICAALRGRGVDALYLHQAQAIGAVLGLPSGGDGGGNGGASGGDRTAAAPAGVGGNVGGRDVIVTTATASGKSLCYAVPFLQSYLAAPGDTKALFIFPTKALAQDQLVSLRRLAATACIHTSNTIDPPGIETYDGDTPKPHRDQIRDGASVLLTNPDMLHASVLPHFRQPGWRAWLRGLRYIVVDEAHIYRGALGCHVALVLRRLLRAVDTLRREEGEVLGVRLVLCSATISNPREHFTNLTGRTDHVAVIDEDGSPQAARVFGLWNPAFVPPNEGGQGGAGAGAGAGARNDGEGNGEEEAVALRKRSPYKDTARLLAALVEQGLKTLVFVKVRYIAEVVLQMTRELLPEAQRDKVASYRAGYLADKRREIEQGLGSGRLLGVVATNALELGVDVGELDVTLHVGFPATVSSLMQQAGRAGRRAGATALSVVIALDGPLDSFLVSHPKEVFARAMEPAVADPDNPVALSEHLLCLLYEATSGDGSVVVREDDLPPSLSLDPTSLHAALTHLASQGHISRVGSTIHLTNRAALNRRPPAARVNIRSIGSEVYRMVEAGSGGRVLETVEADKAFYQLYDGAIYLHQGESYLVTDVDLTQRIATLKRQDVTYYTQPQDHTRVHILGTRIFDSIHVPPPAAGARSSQDGANASLELPLRCGPVKVTKTVYGYKIRDKKTARITDVVELSLPPMEYDTRALWTELPGEIKRRFRVFRGHPPRPTFDRYDRGGLHAIEHLLIALAPLVVPCDPGDLSCQHTRRETDLHRDKLLLFETCRGGTGLTRRLAPHVGRLLRMAWEAVRACPCAEGCQRCIVIGSCYEPDIDKAAAKEILAYLMSGGRVPAGAVEGDGKEGVTVEK